MMKRINSILVWNMVNLALQGLLAYGWIAPATARCCHGSSADSLNRRSEALLPVYFPSARAAVLRADALLKRNDWSSLARCYDLSRTRMSVEYLVSGRFFVDMSISSVGPGAISRYLNPFPPGSKYLSAERLGDAASTSCIWLVKTVLTIDQGGGIAQRVIREFHMIQTKKGFRFLPPANVDDKSASAPAQDKLWAAQGAAPALFYRPALQERAKQEVPLGGASNIPAIVAVVEKLRPLAAARHGRVVRGSLPWEPAEVYEPSDDELLLSLAGDRLWRTTQIAPPGTLANVRRSAPSLPAAIEYPHIEITRVDVAGNGTRYYAAPPVTRRINLKDNP